MKFFIPLLTVSLLLHAAAAHAAQMSYGKYFGTIQMDGHAEAIAVSLDAYITQPNDPAQYPEMEVIVRANLGGFTGPEYVGYHFYDPNFDFDKSVLALNDMHNNLIATLQVTNTDSATILEGPVVERLTNTKGTMRVVMSLDGDNSDIPTAPLLSTLRGDYHGSCGTDPAELQIETGRVLQADAPGNALTGYTITGRLGFSDLEFCEAQANGSPTFCSAYPFSTGTYSPYTNHLTMRGNLGTLDCTKTGDSLHCNVVGYDKQRTCDLTKKTEAPTSPTQIPAGIYMNVPAALKAPLPPAAPPSNSDQMDALNGNFYGFLHYENRDQYQLAEMNVVATTSTENPHIQNRVFVEPTLLLHSGATWDSAPIQSFIFPQRVFFQSQSFTLASDDTETFAVIGNWRSGYVSGVLYSRSYGRIGTFELQKGVKPDIQNRMALFVVPNGNFVGPQEASSPIRGFWQVHLDFPSQPVGALSSADVAPLQARYMGLNIVKQFDASTIDSNSGAITFLLSDPKGDRLVTGNAANMNTLQLLWPTGSAFEAPMTAYQPFTYSLSAQ